MRGLAMVLLVGTLVAGAAYAQEQQESRGPRPDLVYGNDLHSVTLTFYINNATAMREIESILAPTNTSAVLFLSPALASNASVVQSARAGGNLVLEWSDTSSYDARYPPSKFAGIILSDRSAFLRNSKMADVIAFYGLALHSQNSTIISFTPAIPPQMNDSQSFALLEEILQDHGRTLVFDTTPSTTATKISMADIPPPPPEVPAIGANTTSNITLGGGSWDLSALQSRYPTAIHSVSGPDGLSYILNTTVIVGANASLGISDATVMLQSPPVADKDRRIEVQGNLTVSNSEITSWDAAAGAADTNPYHERPFIYVDKGHLQVTNSTIRELGFLAGGFSEERTARAAITIHEGAGFSVVNSTLTRNIDALYARNSSGFTISGNEISANVRTGVDVRANSTHFAILQNHVADNGYEGLMCIACSNASIAGNAIEHNAEAGIKLIMSNFTAIRENDLEYNEKFGIYLRDGSTHNTLQSNTIMQSREGIKLTGNSTDNILVANSLNQNDVPISSDESSSYQEMPTG